MAVAEEFCRRPRSRVGAETLGVSRIVEQSPDGLPERGLIPRIVDEEDGSRVVRVLAEAGIYPSQVSPARSTLESVFLGMTAEDQG